MAYHFGDNVHIRTFTPKDPNIELLDSACKKNIVICLSNKSGKSFVAHKLIQHIYNKDDLKCGTIALYITDSPTVVKNQGDFIRRLTNLSVAEFDNSHLENPDMEWKESLKNDVLVMTSQVAVMLFNEKLLDMANINLLILHGCQCVVREGTVPMKEITRYYFECTSKPHLLGLANSLFVSRLDHRQLEAGIRKLEGSLNCDAETASTAVTGLRYNTQPREVVLECGEKEKCSLDELIENEVHSAISFLDDHQLNLCEIYEGYVDELRIPDPVLEPKLILTELLQIYKTLGPWSAERAVLVLLIQIERLKVTTPYERHFLLLCMTFSVLLKIRAILSDFFENVSDRDRIYKYTSPKILRLIEILRKFQPEKIFSDSDDSDNSDENEVSKNLNPDTARVENIDSENRGTLPELKVTTKNSHESNDLKSLHETELSNENINIKFESLSLTKENEMPGDLSRNETSIGCNEPIPKDSEVHLDNGMNVTLANSNSTDAEILDDGHDLLCGDVQDQKNTPAAGNFNENCEQSVINDSLNNGPNAEFNEISEKISGNPIEKKESGILSVEKSENNTKRKQKQTSRCKFKNGPACNVAKLKENFFQSHEYLLLRRFKFNKYSRLDRNTKYPHLKTIGQDDFFFRLKLFGEPDFQQLCGLIFVEKAYTARVLFYLLNDLKQCDEDFSFLNVQFTIDKVLDINKDPNDAETEHRKQELVLKKFRTRECNLLIGTSFLEEGIDLPKCNLVIRFNTPKDYRSYVRSKERARAHNSLFCLLTDENEREAFVTKLAEYFEIERILLNNSMSLEPPLEEEEEANQYVQLIQPFCPLMKQNTPYINLSTAIAYVNRYCAKLPSDTFTCLTPLWDLKKVDMYDRQMHVCSIRLPINSPMKRVIKGCPMPTAVLARRFAAFQCCQVLHSEGELDDYLQPISKESFWLREEEQLGTGSDEREEIMLKDSNEPRPGTTKRRQYYYKRIANSLTDCRPMVGKKCFLYDISMALTYPLPEEQNTRGRKIHAPEDSFQGFGILTSKTIHQIGAFPIFTRSGEVQVKLRLAQSSVSLSEIQIEKIVDFIHYTFTSVLKLQRYLTMFDPTASENSYFIVPTKRDSVSDVVEVDWEFLELIYQKKNDVPELIPDDARKNFIFDPKKFEDAVITPWYRNQDQPQYFYVAEICYNLSPKSSFPGTEYNTFEEYYFKKYNIKIQNSTQALLDVDHTSARLNFLTPRYVNRKGVALPTTSEEKKKAKRENLEQKQILVPELCDIHPFPGTLWRKAVCLPCVLHRINALLLADQVRRTVAKEIGVGMTELDSDFNWKPLDFGWSLSDVLAASKSSHSKREEKDKEKNVKEKTALVPLKEKTEEKEDKHEEEELDGLPLMEIGTWSNEMAGSTFGDNSYSDDSDNNCNNMASRRFTMYEDSKYCNDLPSRWSQSRMLSDDMSDFSDDDSCSDLSQSNINDSDSDFGGLRIEFKEDNVAEAIENNKNISNLDPVEEDENEPWFYDYTADEEYPKYLRSFEENVEKSKAKILSNQMMYDKKKEFDFIWRSSKSVNSNTAVPQGGCEAETKFGNADNTFPQLIEDIPDSLKNLPHTEIIIKSLHDQRQRKSNEQNDSKPAVNLERDDSYDEFKDDICTNFSFDYQPDLNNHPGPSPSLILQALTMSNANDGINLERLETIGDSFLKYAITAYLYCTYENVHEGKLSHLRSKQVSNYSLYRLGHKKVLGENMIATKFEPHDNWLPPCYYIPRELERALIKTGLPPSHWNRADLPALKNLTDEEICQLVKEKGEQLGAFNPETVTNPSNSSYLNEDKIRCFIPYNLMTQHSIPDKSIADCVEALIGAYLVACGPRGALLFMSWLGIKVLPKEEKFYKSEDQIPKCRAVGTTLPVKIKQGNEEVWQQVSYGVLKSPKPPLLRHVPDPEGELERLLRGFDTFENNIQYHFRDRSYLLQALSHASYSSNHLTDCYQRLEFLGDAVLDYLITRHLYEDPRHHSPGALTDLRSALVNNTIFASLAVRHDFHKYFRHFCPLLNEVFDRFVRTQEENGHSINEEFYLLEEEEFEEVEDVEVPKALGDIFESIAGAIFLDSGMSLDVVWRVYYRIMKKEIELFSTNVPKSPIRELFELEPETAQFGKPEKLADGKRVRVTVEVFGKGVFNGIGRNYRIAKCTAAKCALKKLKDPVVRSAKCEARTITVIPNQPQLQMYFVKRLAREKQGRMVLGCSSILFGRE